MAAEETEEIATSNNDDELEKEELSKVTDDIECRQSTNIISSCENETSVSTEAEDKKLSTIYQGLSQLGLNADGTSQVFLNLTLVDKELYDLDFLPSYQHLQILDVSHNFLTDLEKLEYLQCLISLNVSNNQLTRVFEDKSPVSIREVNFSYNNIAEINDLSPFTLLNTLLLDHNCISEIQGLDNCRHLKNLSLSFNNITKISGLNNLPLKQVDLSNNDLRKIENLEQLKYLQYINLSCNKIRSLNGLQDHHLLEEINLDSNEILDISEMRYLRNLNLLRILNFNGNPIQNMDDYRLSVLFKLSKLVELDTLHVTAENKSAAMNLFAPSEELVSSRDYMYNLMASYQQPTTLTDSTLSSNEPYPMLVICGPTGLGKKYLAKKLSLEFPSFFGVGVGHTTRPICTNLQYGSQPQEQIGVAYHYLAHDDFDQHREQGLFIQTCSLFGHDFGISRQVIETVAEQGLACVLTMELEGVMAFKRSHFEPRYVLMLPNDITMYRCSLEESNRYNDAQIDKSVKRIQKYIDVNQNHPGFFDAVILSDDIDDRYNQLKHTVLEYLGITPPTTSIGSLLSIASTHKICSGSRLFSREKVISSSLFMRNMSSGVLKLTESETLPTAVQSSFDRRYEKTRAAMLGVTSSFDEQLRKITTPASATVIPYMRAYENLKDEFREDSSHHKSTSGSVVKALSSSKESTPTLMSSDESQRMTSATSSNDAEISSSEVSVM